MTVICDALTRDKSAVSRISQKSYKIGGGLDTPKLLHHGYTAMASMALSESVEWTIETRTLGTEISLGVFETKQLFV